MRLFLPSKDVIRHASWLYSQMRFSPPASLINSTILSRSLRDARRAGENTTISRPNASAKQAQKIAMLREKGKGCWQEGSRERKRNLGKHT